MASLSADIRIPGNLFPYIVLYSNYDRAKMRFESNSSAAQTRLDFMVAKRIIEFYPYSLFFIQKELLSLKRFSCRF